MQLSKKLLTLPVLAALGAAMTSAGHAGAADPLPTPCTGIVAKDPAKDDSVAFTALNADPTRRIGENPNLDIREYFFTYRPNEQGKMVLTAHISVTNLTKNVPAEAGPERDVSWWAEFDTVEGISYVKAVTNGTDVKFEYGAVGAATTTPTPTTGKFIEGPNGVVSIDFPADTTIKPGMKLPNAFAMATQSGETQDRALRVFADRAPDDGAAAEKSYTVTPCPDAAPAAPAEAPQTAPQPQPQPQQPPQGGGGQAGAGGSGGRVAPQLSFAVKPGRDARPPFVFRTSGKLSPPSGVDRDDACQGRVSVQVKNGKKTVSNRRAQVRRDCTFAQAVKISNRKRLGKARSLRVIVTFQGNKVLLPQKAKPRSVRVR